MSREEAIANLKMIRVAFVLPVTKEQRKLIDDTFEMAIQALSQEPCDDTVSIRKDVLKCRVGNIVAYNVEWLKKHWQMEMDIVCGIKPCDDAVSREEVKKIVDFYTEQYDGIFHVNESIDKLPSVTHKSGKWIAQDIHNCHTDFKCSECGYIHSFMHLYGEPTADYTYCPNCGAKMESEVRNDNK